MQRLIQCAASSYPNWEKLSGEGEQALRCQDKVLFDAIRELLAADREYDEAREQYLALSETSNNFIEVFHRLDTAKKRRAAALARFEGVEA